MARLEPDDLADCDLALVFIAGTTREAKRAEEILTRDGIDYALGPEPFLRAGMFGAMTLLGLGIFVRSGQAQYCRHLLRQAALSRGVVEDDEANS